MTKKEKLAFIQLIKSVNTLINAFGVISVEIKGEEEKKKLIVNINDALAYVSEATDLLNKEW